MLIDLYLYADAEYIRIEVPQINDRWQIPNVIVVDRPSQCVVTIGETQEQIRINMGEKWDTEKHRLLLRPVFGGAEIENPKTIEAIEYLILLTYEKNSPQSTRHIAHSRINVSGSF